ncbi:MAG: hypothetical protein JW909_09190 [Planctomycetes bacterium]|nr:hypothetical protein [Planctomycetota bacterium]
MYDEFRMFPYEHMQEMFNPHTTFGLTTFAFIAAWLGMLLMLGALVVKVLQKQLWKGYFKAAAFTCLLSYISGAWGIGLGILFCPLRATDMGSDQVYIQAIHVALRN